MWIDADGLAWLYETYVLHLQVIGGGVCGATAHVIPVVCYMSVVEDS